MSGMGSSGQLAVDHVDSHVRLRGPDVELVLCGLPDDVGDGAKLVLSRDGITATAPVEVRDSGDTRDLVVRTPRSGLSDGQWGLTLTASEERTVDVRLLVQGNRPLVLLVGASPRRSAVPKRKVRRARPAPRALTTTQKLARAGGRVLDQALRVLPEARAASARKRARGVARNVLR
jgi:hypothetical protein